MQLTPESLVILGISFFIIAVLYSSVGFGGGSSYLALLTLFFASFFVIRSVALVCNLVVVSGSTILYYRRGHFDIKKFVPFVVTSIPLAFLGASYRLEEYIFFIILGIALMISAISLGAQSVKEKRKRIRLTAKKYPWWITCALGAAIGFLSGLVGIGGGIFLAPILNHMRWDFSIKVAALASFFILVNSISGIAGLVTNDMFVFPWKEGLILLAIVFVGGQIGIRISLNKLSGKSIKLLTAVLVFLVGLRVLLNNGLGLINI
ncbi:sulfite exporter TauE/SafE family protein [Galbibacter sp. EGI 63066]|uniref:sulfite exporter TauE/SafE family protein n=1 Tax=Galbibacter sp. EGI 63066 TaxID=2993559 RepID=UPI0022494C3B|nr:sulfite exporter TauE/SafE family protein [Galbibacter sp. EGI 63066]MCX2679940.1 sulfite exporter TauE/SafE family protein [Galbibacter sp. EGI 63066]